MDGIIWNPILINLPRVKLAVDRSVSAVVAPVVLKRNQRVHTCIHVGELIAGHITVSYKLRVVLAVGRRVMNRYVDGVARSGKLHRRSALRNRGAVLGFTLRRKDIRRTYRVELHPILVDQGARRVQSGNVDIELVSASIEHTRDGVSLAVVHIHRKVCKAQLTGLPLAVGVQVHKRDRGDRRVAGISARHQPGEEQNAHRHQKGSEQPQDSDTSLA